MPQICKRWKGVIDSCNEWHNCRISSLYRQYSHFKQTTILRSGTEPTVAISVLHSTASHLMRCSHVTRHLACCNALCAHVCRWFQKHSRSIKGLVLLGLQDDTRAPGLRASFIPVLFGILSRTLQKLTVVECGQVRQVWQSCCMAVS